MSNPATVEHSPTPWTFDADFLTNDHERVVMSAPDAEGERHRVAVVSPVTILRFTRGGAAVYDPDCPIRDANARRILACLSACEGVSTEELEAKAFADDWLARKKRGSDHNEV